MADMLFKKIRQPRTEDEQKQDVRRARQFDTLRFYDIDMTEADLYDFSFYRQMEMHPPVKYVCDNCGSCRDGDGPCKYDT